MNIRGKSALITGGAVRLGRAIALGLAGAGAHVAINYHQDKEEAERTLQELLTHGVNAMAFQADISKPEQVKRMFAEIHARFGPIDILINNASLFKPTPLPGDSFEAWHEVTGVLINGSFYVSNLAAMDMLERGEGVIVNILDLAAWEAWPRFAGHVVGKSALLALTRQLAIDLAPHVRVNAVAPGPILPPRGYSEEKVGRIADRTLLGRWGTLEDVSRAVNFLIESDYVNAEVLTVDGGERYGRRKAQPG